MELLEDREVLVYERPALEVIFAALAPCFAVQTQNIDHRATYFAMSSTHTRSAISLSVFDDARECEGYVWSEKCVK